MSSPSNHPPVPPPPADRAMVPAPTPPAKMVIPVEAGKVGVYYDEKTKVISHYASYPNKGNIITAIPVVIADNDNQLKDKISELGLIERK